MRCHTAQIYILRAQREPLSPHETQAVARHLVDCPSCRKEREAMERMASLLKSVPVPSPQCVIRSDSLRKRIDMLPPQHVRRHRMRRAFAFSALPALCGLIVIALYVRQFYEKRSSPFQDIASAITAPTKSSRPPLLSGTNKEVGLAQEFSPESFLFGKKEAKVTSDTSDTMERLQKAKPAGVRRVQPSPSRRLARLTKHPHKIGETRVARTQINSATDFSKSLPEGDHADPSEGLGMRHQVYIVVGTVASSDHTAVQRTVVRRFVMERIPSGPPPSRFASFTSPSTNGSRSQEAQAW